MKNWIKGLFVGLIISSIVLTYFFIKASKVYTSFYYQSQKACEMKKICDTCSGQSDCLKNNYQKKFPQLYQNAANYNLSQDSFKNVIQETFCGSSTTQRCENKKSFLYYVLDRRVFHLALTYIGTSIMIGSFFLNAAWIIGALSLILIIAISISIGYYFDIKKQANNLNL